MAVNANAPIKLLLVVEVVVRAVQVVEGHEPAGAGCVVLQAARIPGTAIKHH